MGQFDILSIRRISQRFSHAPMILELVSGIDEQPFKHKFVWLISFDFLFDKNNSSNPEIKEIKNKVSILLMEFFHFIIRF